LVRVIQELKLVIIIELTPVITLIQELEVIVMEHIKLTRVIEPAKIIGLTKVIKLVKVIELTKVIKLVMVIEQIMG
jgi:hypothetical protein